VARAAHEQRNAERPLQVTDVTADLRLRKAERQRGPAEVQFLGNGDERAQVVQTEIDASSVWVQ
jgi:hypothetical protein